MRGKDGGVKQTQRKHEQNKNAGSEIILELALKRLDAIAIGILIELSKRQGLPGNSIQERVRSRNDYESDGRECHTQSAQ